MDPEPTDQVHFYLEPLVTSASVNMPRMPPLPRDALPLPRDAVPLTVSASKVVGSVSPLVDLSRGGYSWPQATSANCQESWCREVLFWGVGGEGVWVWVGVLILSLSLSLSL